LLIPITKAFLNDQRFRKKKAVILQAEMERLSDTLFDHSITEGK